jgi:hypothetical protein
MALATAAGQLFRRGRDGGGLRNALALASRVSGSRASTSSATLPRVPRVPRPLADAEEAPGASEKVPKAGIYTRSREGSTCATPGHIHEIRGVIKWTEELKLS